MQRKRIDTLLFRSGSWLARAILPLPDYCQDLLYHRILDKWLRKHPNLANAIVWETASGPVAYPQWSIEMKGQLRRGFPFSYPFTLVDPPANMTSLADSDFPSTSLSEDAAWSLYLNLVSQSLVVEFWGSVSWSLEDLPSEQLAILLDSRATFSRNANTGHYDVGMFLSGIATSAPPDLTFRFLTDTNLIGATRLETIGRLLDWCRENLIHFSGPYEALNMEYQWQYRGFTPVSRVLTGTTNDNPTPGYTDMTLRHRTSGCHGTNGFLKAVLRTVNIPVAYRRPPSSGHATPFFPSEGKLMSHGDDPYNAHSKTTPRYPAGDLLIDQATYDSWFSTGMSDPNLNVGRQVYELALVHLSDYLLHLHCSDLSAGRSHDQSDVYATFSRWYTVPELEAINLWGRLDAKIASFGGCNYIP